ncbi:ABC transporter permease [Streptomyces sp. TRM68367]|uniref:ABC transporter permease n=1 Tax=Streptomyces sp. TRM68367 TaxID=2758415 RepID=UPI00165C7DE2|nr:ABC transporter permease [Streptomyces sp. TRM68367]MBC9728132.1 ABC transporter permease [Streptomyces sp. TRM68367]
MSTTVIPPTPTGSAPEPAREGHGLSSVLALARFEARELLMQIAVLCSLLLYVGYTGWKLFNGREGMDEFPALQDADRATQALPQLVGIAVLVCVNRAVLRSRQHSTYRHFDVLPMPAGRRTVAHALSVVPFAALVTLVVALEFTWVALKPGAVGHGSSAELAVGPLGVLLAGFIGVLLARLLPSSFAAPIFVIGVYAASSVLGDVHWLEWLWPVVNDTGGDPLPSGLLGRPAAWHALYLAGLAALALCGAVLLSGGRTWALRAATGVALAATVTGVAGQSPGDSPALLAAREQASVAPEREQTCLPHGTSTYCAFPEWTGRTADWAAVAGRVQALAGGSAAREKLTVRQRIDARYGLQDDASIAPSGGRGEVTVGTRWGGNRIPEFAVGAASVLVAGDEESGGEVCDARVVTIMWLALGTERDPMTALRNVRVDDSVEGSAVVLTPTNPLTMTAEQTQVVRHLLARPRGEVTAAVKSHWAELTSPRTPLTRVADLLGVKARGEGAGDGDSCEG